MKSKCRNCIVGVRSTLCDLNPIETVREKDYPIIEDKEVVLLDIKFKHCPECGHEIRWDALYEQEKDKLDKLGLVRIG